MPLTEVVVFMLIKNNTILVETRKKSKRSDPNKTVIPGGKVESKETHEEALLRETKEELGIFPEKYNHVCSLVYDKIHLHYYKITSWTGEIKNNEAEKLSWVPLSNPKELDLDVDKEAINKLL